MAEYTTNYNLKKPLLTEKYSVEDQNGNMDILDSEIRRLDTGMADLAGEIDDLQEQVDNISPSDPDKGRYQVDFSGFDEASLVDTLISNDKLELLKRDIIKQEAFNTSYDVSTTAGIGQKLSSVATRDIEKIESVEVYIETVSTNAVLEISIYDDTDNTLLGEVQQNYTNLNVGWNTFKFDSPILVNGGNTILIRAITKVGNSAYKLKAQYSNIKEDENFISTNIGWGGAYSDNLTVDFTYRLNIITKSLSGAATKTITPSDLKKWGNIKYNAHVPTNTSVKTEIYSNIANQSYITDSNDAVENYQNTVDIYDRNYWRACKFQATNDAIEEVFLKVKIGSFGSPYDMLIEIYDENGGLPNNSIGSTSVSKNDFTSALEERLISLPLNSSIASGETYFVVFHVLADTSSSNRFSVASKTGATDGNYYISNNTGVSWTASDTVDVWFRIGYKELIKTHNLSEGENIIDLSDIDKTLYPTLKTKFTLNRDSVDDESPTVSDFSITWEGEEILVDKNNGATYKLVVIDAQPFLEVVSI